MQWFSAMVVLTTTVEGVGDSSYWRTVFVFRSADKQDAIVRAEELGREQEESYRNGDGNLVRDSFRRVATIDELGDSIDDGMEVWSEGYLIDDDSDQGTLQDHLGEVDQPPGSAGIGPLK